MFWRVLSHMGPADYVHGQRNSMRGSLFLSRVSWKTVIRSSINLSVLAVYKVGTVVAVDRAWSNSYSFVFSFGVGVTGCPGLLT